eukprot:8905620-Heterocapsa_arctica.AAC.1
MFGSSLRACRLAKGAGWRSNTRLRGLRGCRREQLRRGDACRQKKGERETERLPAAASTGIRVREFDLVAERW